MVSPCLPMQLLDGQTAIPHALDQTASAIVAQHRPASNAQSQHFSWPNHADAASGVKHKAVKSAAATTVNRLSDAKSTGTSAGSAEAPPDTNQPAALLPPAAQLRGIITDACRTQSTFTSPQLPPSAKDILLLEQQATGPQATDLSASTPLRTQASATAICLTEPAAAATQAMEPLFAEAAACGLSEGCHSPCNKREPLPPQLSSIFGSPETSMSEQRGQTAVGADSDSIVISPKSAQSQSCQTLFHQQSKADSPVEAFEAARATFCPVASPNQLQGSTPEIASLCAPHSTASPTVTTNAECVDHGDDESGAQARSPPSASSSSFVVPANSDAEIAASTAPGLPVTCPLLDASAARMVLPAPFAYASDVTRSQDARPDMSWVAARASASEGGESSSGRYHYVFIIRYVFICICY